MTDLKTLTWDERNAVTLVELLATIENGFLVIKLPLQTPTPSGSGKTLVIASTRGNVKNGLLHAGKPVTIGVNAYIPAK